MQDIADAVDLQKASLYHHVDGKQDILLSILDQALDILIQDVEAVIASNGSAADKLQRAMRVYLERLTSEADLAAVLLLEHRSLEPDLRAAHIVRRDRFEALWRSMIQQGVNEGIFRPVDVSLASFALLGVQNWVITWYREGGRQSAADLADHFSRLFLEGLLQEPESE